MPAAIDVAIIGGGSAGMAAALTLRKRDDIKVTVFERSDYTTPKNGESLSPGVRDLLHYLDVWDAFQHEQIQNLFATEAAWGSDSLGAMDFILTTHGAGWTLDRLAFEKMLMKAAEHAGAAIHLNTSVEDIHWDGQCWQLRTAGKSYSARYVIDAAGRVSPFSVQHGATRMRNDDLICISARLPQTAQIAQVSRIEAITDGWWYAVPLPCGNTIVSLFADPATIHAKRLSDKAVWHAHLCSTQYIQALIDPQIPPPDLISEPAFSACLHDMPDTLPIIAAGDACAARDPLSSSGIPNAIAGGIQAARVAADWMFGQGALREAYFHTVSLDHSAYLRTHWRTYKTETRWPENPFWRFRQAQISRPPTAQVRITPGASHTIFAPKPVAAWIAQAAQKPLCQSDLMASARAQFPQLPDERLLLAIEDLTESTAHNIPAQ